MLGSEHNDLFEGGENGLLRAPANKAGGTLGGISSGENLVFRVGIKPASSISKNQETANFDGSITSLSVKGRHDPCVLPRAPPLIEGMAALVVADACMRQRARAGTDGLKTLYSEASANGKRSAPAGAEEPPKKK